MAKVYVLTEKDFEKLIEKVTLGSELKESDMSQDAIRAWDDAFRVFNYRIRRWIDEVSE